MSEIVSGQVGPETKYAVKFEGGKLVVSGGFDSKIFDAGLTLALDTDAVIDELAKAIPGQIDDAVLQLVKAALKAV